MSDLCCQHFKSGQNGNPIKIKENPVKFYHESFSQISHMTYKKSSVNGTLALKYFGI